MVLEKREPLFPFSMIQPHFEKSKWLCKIYLEASLIQLTLSIGYMPGKDKGIFLYIVTVLFVFYAFFIHAYFSVLREL